MKKIAFLIGIVILSQNMYSQNLLWVKQFGAATKFNEGKDIAIDDIGNSYVVGSISGAVDFGGTTLTPTTSNCWFLFKI